ncbi:MAG TPA: hypothetical protein ACHBX0_09360 [Arsenophonus sp.]
MWDAVCRGSDVRGGAGRVLLHGIIELAVPFLKLLLLLLEHLLLRVKLSLEKFQLSLKGVLFVRGDALLSVVRVPRCGMSRLLKDELQHKNVTNVY